MSTQPTIRAIIEAATEAGYSDDTLIKTLEEKFVRGRIIGEDDERSYILPSNGIDDAVLVITESAHFEPDLRIRPIQEGDLP